MPATARAACPDLSAFYPGNQPDWAKLEQQLAPLLPQCLDSSEFFALHGAAQLNSGQLAAALESLERALLTDPDNGAALIDYAQALFEQGQLFSALEINAQLLQRIDLPANLEPVLASRQRTWQALTRQTSFQVDVLAGYDDNLNGGLDSDQLTLTLSGDPVALALNREFRPISGPHLNARLAVRHRRLSPQTQHNWSAEVRGRLSEDQDSDVLQVATFYSFLRPDRRRSWQLNAGMNHLFFGGSAVFSGTGVNARYQPGSNLRCKPDYGLALQHQLFHNQTLLNGIETKAAVGFNCPLGNANGSQQLRAEFSLLHNSALKSGRLGEDRRGWQVNLDWQLLLPHGTVHVQLNHTRLDDDEGYSALLANGAKRTTERSFLLIRYRRPLRFLGRDTTLLMNISHQRQRSNIELFRSTNTSAEIGFSWAF
ncbi:MAG: tetratricopeptide repeat protein [Proteobacteria bacterium]|nr:tetratricopeptide repeat protein [Pseudomonadota bacterium]